MGIKQILKGSKETSYVKVSVVILHLQAVHQLLINKAFSNYKNKHKTTNKEKTIKQKISHA